MREIKSHDDFELEKHVTGWDSTYATYLGMGPCCNSSSADEGCLFMLDRVPDCANQAIPRFSACQVSSADGLPFSVRRVPVAGEFPVSYHLRGRPAAAARGASRCVLVFGAFDAVCQHSDIHIHTVFGDV